MLTTKVEKKHITYINNYIMNKNKYEYFPLAIFKPSFFINLLQRTGLRQDF